MVIALSVHGFLIYPPKNWSGCNVRLRTEKEGIWIVRKAYTSEQIINKLREAEIILRKKASPTWQGEGSIVDFLGGLKNSQLLNAIK